MRLSFLNSVPTFCFILLAAVAVVAQDPVVSLHASGTDALCLELVMEALVEQAQSPVRLTYRTVSEINFGGNFTHDFGAGHLPLSTSDHTDLAQTTTVWHLPYAAEVVGLYHSLEGLGEVPLNLTSCLIAKIFKRNITSWKDAALIKENPFLQDLPDESSPITVVHRDRSSAITQAYTEYLARSCPKEWSTVSDRIAFPQGSLPCEPSESYCMSTSKGAIAFMNVNHDATGVQEVALANRAGFYLTTNTVNRLDGLTGLVSTDGLPSSPTDDFGTYSVVYQDGVDTWPLQILYYVYVRLDSVQRMKHHEMGLMVAFFQALYQGPYVFECDTILGIIPAIGHARDLGLQAIGEIKNSLASLQEWEFDLTEGDPMPSSDFSFSAFRRTFAADRQRMTEREIESLQVDADEKDMTMLMMSQANKLLEKAVIDLKQRVEQLESKPPSGLPTQSTSAVIDDVPSSTYILRTDDDTRIDVMDGLPVFTEKDSEQLTAALSMAAVSFSCWSIYFLWKTWRYFLKPRGFHQWE